MGVAGEEDVDIGLGTLNVDADQDLQLLFHRVNLGHEPQPHVGSNLVIAAFVVTGKGEIHHGARQRPEGGGGGGVEVVVVVVVVVGESTDLAVVQVWIAFLDPQSHSWHGIGDY